MNVYPGIYEAKDGNIYLYQNKDNYFSYQMECWKKSDLADAHPDDKNITADHLRNTYGKVDSKEHAEFIVKLAEGAAFDADEYHQVDKWFCFSENHLFFFIEESGASDAKEKLITLPLPPKEESMNKPTIKVTLDGQTVYESEDLTLELITKEDFYFNPALKSLQVGGFEILGKDKSKTNPLIGDWQGEEVKWRAVGRIDKESEEWPAVGDEVLTTSNEKAVVKAVDGGLAWIKYDREDLGYATEYVKSLKKPPTPEEELESELRVFINIESWESCKDLSKAIINGEIKGLSYEQE